MQVNGKQGNLISIRYCNLLYGYGVFRKLRVSLCPAMHRPLHDQKLQHNFTTLEKISPDIAQIFSELNDLLLKKPDSVLKYIITLGLGDLICMFSAPVGSTHFWNVPPASDNPHDGRHAESKRAEIAPLDNLYSRRANLDASYE